MGGKNPWLEEYWNSEDSACFSLPRPEFSFEETMIHNSIRWTAKEFRYLVQDEQFLADARTTQDSYAQYLKRILDGQPISLNEGTVHRFDFMYLTAQFKEEIIREGKPLLSEGKTEIDWEEATKFSDLLFQCSVEPKLHRIQAITLNGDMAQAIVETRAGGFSGKDTLRAMPPSQEKIKYSVPYFGEEVCPDVRFDLVKVKGEWLIDHREILK
jgi:hypothetical protein